MIAITGEELPTNAAMLVTSSAAVPKRLSNDRSLGGFEAYVV
jgi:hypothetical protein